MSYRFASLSSGLLARKGAAQPAMASHSGGNPRPMREDALTPMPRLAAPERESGFRPATVLANAGFAFESDPPPFPAQARVPAEPPKRPIPFVPAPPKGVDMAQACGASGACSVADASPADPARRFHVSVRLRQGHFVRLKIASAQLRKPSQEIVAEALSAYFNSLDPSLFGDCACSREG